LTPTNSPDPKDDESNPAKVAQRLTKGLLGATVQLGQSVQRKLASHLVIARQPPSASVQDAQHSPANEPNPAWSAILDAVPQAAVALDESSIVLHHNQAALELFPKIKTGQPVSHISRNPEFLAAIERGAAANAPILVELLERVPVERRVFVTLSPLALPPSSGSQPVLLLTFRDDTEHERLSQMRADFIANASHELRTPLATMRGFIETLQGPARNDSTARDRFLSMMGIEATRMTQLIDDLLSLSRAEMLVHLPPGGTVELNDTAAFVIRMLDPLAHSSLVTVKLHRLNAPAIIRGDRDEIIQVLQNLVENAIKYTQEGGEIEVRLSRQLRAGKPHDQLAVAVVDNGPGIAPEHLPRLTERFYRANAASSKAKGGTGLGLAIVKHIVNRHRGELKIQSRLGHGSTFAVLFDALQSEGSAVKSLTVENK
jgi:two-component system, OmpR family, phosphate regulon sensor histidine kinase PhoR